tara:strand:- start:269 stop:646 length:378 start_codon:yes stop_codon:yes gene_type:complete
MSKYQEEEQMNLAINKIKEDEKEKIRKEKKIISKRKYRNSEKGHREHRRWDWQFKNKIICDYDAIYDIVMETNYCDFCSKKLVFRGSKPSHDSKCLDHCHTCGGVRGVLCNICNLQNVLVCELCN